MQNPNCKEEQKLWNKGYSWVAGVDEVGVGPLAGGVTAAAVMLPAELKNKTLKIFHGVRDSKKLSGKQREYFYNRIISTPHIFYAVSSVSSRVIDNIGIRKATELSMFRSLGKLPSLPEFVIFDGPHISSQRLKVFAYRALVRADEKVLSCALASIIAKVTRDRAMLRFHKKYPQYRFDLHKGYGTKVHAARMKKYGPSPIHRKSFIFSLVPKRKGKIKIAS